MGRRRPLIATVVMCLVVSACGSTDPDDSGSATTATTTTSTTTSTKATTTVVAPLAAEAAEAADVSPEPPAPRAVGTTSGDGPAEPETEAETDADDGSAHRPLTDLQVGDCVDLPGIGADTPSGTTAILHACDHPHDAEVFARPSLNDDPEGPHPGDDEVLAAADRVCLDAFEGYVGRPYVDTSLEIVHLRPNEAAWVRGDRIVVCALVSLDGEPLLAPVKEAA